MLTLVQGKKHIVLINKIDEENKVNKEELQEKNIIEISVKKQLGLEQLEEKIEEMFHCNDLETGDTLVITNMRHQELITNAKRDLENALLSAKAGVPLDMLSIDITNSIQSLGEITGESISEEVVKGIFAKFCLGK